MEIGFLTLKQFVPLASFRQELLPLLGSSDHEVRQFCVPTEIVVIGPELVVPRMARAFQTQFYHYKEGCFLEHYEIRKRLEASGAKFIVDNHPNAWLVEVWSDRGDDGHTDYCHSGYRLVLETALEEPYPYDKLPLLMHDDKECGRFSTA